MFSFNIKAHRFKHIHFIGIGGVSMSGLAEILLSHDYLISGSDVNDSLIINRLRQKGAKIYIGHNKKNIQDIDLVVYTSAISEDNPEYLASIEKGIPTVDRATFLGALMKSYKDAIAVAGTHGKTTTTGMLSMILDTSDLSPTILLGGELDKIGGNVKIGENNCLLTEACEYKGNFLRFFPTIGVVLNIEEDHLDYFKDLHQIVDTFIDFALLIPKDGILIINNDDKHADRITQRAQCEVVTFSIEKESHIKGTHIHHTREGYPCFDVEINGKEAFSITLSVMGIHNVYNALAAIGTAYKIGVPIDVIKTAIENYTGTHRRFEDKGSFNNIRIIDDYAHHPTAIGATLSTARKIVDNKLWCVFQPHTYTRTKALLDAFSTSFGEADKVIVTDIYAAREKDTGMVHSKDLVRKLKEHKVDAIYIEDFNAIVHYLKEHLQEGDLTLIMGAGDIYKVGDQLIDKFKN